MTVKVKLGYVPSCRGRWTDWCQKMKDDTLEALAKIDNVEVVVSGKAEDGERCAAKVLTPTGGVCNLDDGEAVYDYFCAEKVDGVILSPVDFGDERSAAIIAQKLGVPILVFATKEPPAHNTPGMGRVSDSYCGNLSLTSALYRRKLAFYYAGIYFPDEPEFLEEAKTFAKACAVVKGMKYARIGQVGVRPPTFETVGYDEHAMVTKFGMTMAYANMADIVDAAEAMADDDPRVVENIKKLQGDFDEITVADDYLVKSSKFELALVDYFEKMGLTAMAVQCWPSIQRMMGISLCSVYGRMTERGMLTACEVDVLGALAMICNYYGTMGTVLPHFVDWTIQHRENPNWLLAWHCGNAPISLAKDPVHRALRSRKDMTGDVPYGEGDVQAGLNQFQLKPGKVTFCRLQEYDNEWKMLIATGDIIPSDETLAGNWSWVEVTDHAKLYRTLVEEGFIHHASMIHGDQTAVLLQACKYLGIEPVVVD